VSVRFVDGAFRQLTSGSSVPLPGARRIAHSAFGDIGTMFKRRG
jgi:hypothetical protein